jgi:L-asparaginase
MVAALGQDNLDLLGVEVTTIQFGNKGSGSYTVADLSALSLLVDSYLSKYEYAGVVVTSGTDTMEEIGYFLDLTVQITKPVVITGSMRPWSYLEPGQDYDGNYSAEKYVLGTDAPANLYNAIAIAASGKTKNFGTVLSLNDTIYSVRDVTKTNAHRLDTFDAYLGRLGYVDEGKVSIYNIPARALRTGADWTTPFNLNTILDLSFDGTAYQVMGKDGQPYNFPRVEIAVSYQEAGSGGITGYIQAGAKGIVTAGTGAGGISGAMGGERNTGTEQGVVFVTTTRTGSGTMYDDSRDETSRIIYGDSLNPYHARLMLLLTLIFTDDVPMMHEWFRKYARTAL